METVWCIIRFEGWFSNRRVRGVLVGVSVAVIIFVGCSVGVLVGLLWNLLRGEHRTTSIGQWSSSGHFWAPMIAPFCNFPNLINMQGSNPIVRQYVQWPRKCDPLSLSFFVCEKGKDLGHSVLKCSVRKHVWKHGVPPKKAQTGWELGICVVKH